MLSEISKVFYYKNIMLSEISKHILLEEYYVI